MSSNESSKSPQTIRIQRARGGVSVKTDINAGVVQDKRKDKWIPIG